MDEPKHAAGDRPSVIDWPAIWARDEKFWREVATRTIAGALALVLLSGPSVIYLMIAGQLSASVVFPILIGLAFVVLAIFIWWIVRSIGRMVERRGLRRAVERDASGRRGGPVPSAADLARYVRDFQAARESRGDPFGQDIQLSMTPKPARIRLSEQAQREMRAIERRVNLGATLLGAVATG